MPTFKAVPEYFDIPGQGLGVSQGESMSNCPAPGQGLGQGLVQTLEQALANPSHKLLVLCRHGQGHHNVCESTFGTEKWESQVALQPTFGEIVLEDAHLTDLGMQQVRDAGTNLLAPLVQTLGWPERMYCSPMRRCIETFMESWGAVAAVQPSASPEAEDEQSPGELPQELPQELPHDIVKTWIMGQGSGPSPDPDQLASQYPGQGYSIVTAHVSETFRETLGRHYCDKRVSHSETIGQYGTRTLVLPAPKSAPTLHVSWQYPNNPPMDEEDTMWSPTHRETDDEIDARIGPGLNEILSGPERYISLTCHSGVIHSALRVLGHPPLRQLLTGGVVFVVVTPEPCAV